jgi:hypothetical protein
LLKPPASTFSSLELPVADLNAAQLLRISSHNSGEPFFGKTRKNRFDDVRKIPKSKKFGTCYTGATLECAFAETVLHNRVAVSGGFIVPQEEVTQRFVVSFEDAALEIAVLLGEHLKTLGGDGELSTITPYTLPRQWSLAIHEHPAKVDGIAYMSKHINNQWAVVLFDRAKKKLVAKDVVPFPDYAGALRTTLRLKVSLK